MDTTFEDYTQLDEFPKVSSDGEPHEVLTMVAVGSGLVAAIAVLFVLVLLINCRQRESAIRTKKRSSKTNIFTIFSQKAAFDLAAIEAGNLKASSTFIGTTTIAFNGARHLDEDVFTNKLTGISTITC